MGFFSKIWDDIKAEIDFQKDEFKHGLGLKPSDEYMRVYNKYHGQKQDEPSNDNNPQASTEQEPKSITICELVSYSTDRDNEADLDTSATELYLQKQQVYYELLSEQVAWQQEKEQRELSLQEDKARYAYDLECRRIAMEKELRQYEMQIQNEAVNQAQQIEIRRLYMEIERLKNLLEKQG